MHNFHTLERSTHIGGFQLWQGKIVYLPCHSLLIYDENIYCLQLIWHLQQWVCTNAFNKLSFQFNLGFSRDFPISVAFVWCMRICRKSQDKSLFGKKIAVCAREIESVCVGGGVEKDRGRDFCWRLYILSNKWMNSQQLNWRDANTTINLNKFPEFGCIEKSFVIGVFGDFIFGYIFNNRIPIEGR